MIRRPPRSTQDQSTRRICLLQGPPGTGKSRTIAGLVYQVLHQVDRPARVLLTAPSNAAVDQVVRALRELIAGHPTSRISVVRVGKDVADDLRDISLEQLALRASRNTKSGLHSVNMQVMRLEKDKQIIKTKMVLARERGDQWTCNVAQGQLKDITHRLNKMNRKVELSPAEAKRRVLADCNVVAATLNGAGNATLTDTFRAGQATEMDSMVPFVYGTNHLVLVGDPKQLAPTVLSHTARNQLYDQSLMTRMYAFFRTSQKSPVRMLTEQYRMRPDIACFPSKHFYDNKLNTHQSCINRIQSPLRPYLFFDVQAGIENQGEQGCSNAIEAQFTCDLVLKLARFCRGLLATDMGVITPYRAQLKMIKSGLQKCLPGPQPEVRTVDGFQGREKHVIAISCVRAGGSSIGFLTDLRRLNVALTRAKDALFIIGHCKTLEVSADWCALISDARDRGLVVSVTSSDARHIDDALRHCFV